MLAQTVNIESVIKPNTEANSDLPRVGDGEILDGPTKDTERPLPLLALLTRPVVVSVANYGMIALLDITAGTLISFIWSTPVEFGGLNLSPASIGLWTAGYGFMNCVLQFVAFPGIVRRFGPRRVFIASILCFLPIYIMFPLENLALRHSSDGLNTTAGLLMVLQLSAASFSTMGSGKFLTTLQRALSLKRTCCGSNRCDIYVRIHRRPNKRSLGATNGVAQTIISIQRTVGPAAAASLFAFSLENNVLRGNFVYVVLLAVVWVGLGVAVQLPNNMWNLHEP
jgi:hypothetical protein